MVLHFSFFIMLKLTLMMVITTDGFIAKRKDQPSIEWTSNADKELFVEKTKQAGVIIMGNSTYKTINRPLPDRLIKVLTRTPEQFTNIEGQIEYTNKQPKELLKELEEKGFSETIIAGGTQVNSLFLDQKLVDELLITIEPILFGGGLTLFKDLDLSIKLELLEYKDLGNNVINLKYKIIK